MSERTLIPIFVLWALLTIITPTLILLSENSKADLDSTGNMTEGMKVRRIIGFRENNVKIAESPLANNPEEEKVSAPAPFSTASHSLHNYTLKSNSTSEEHTISSHKIQEQVKHTSI